ncbi:MAG: response regulator transcription factor [Victivallales bacterium]|jgi:two component transcriptional regulator, winged helix family
MSKGRILVVDDEEDILELVKYNLEREGYLVDCVDTGEEAIERAVAIRPDGILLDLMLPGVDGIEVCRELRKNPDTRTIPIIMMTAKGEEADVVSGLEVGADDYVPKPFSTKVLVARLRALLRRTAGETDSEAGEVIRRGTFLLDLGRREASINGKPLDLTFTEFEILRLLAKRPGWVYSRSRIVNEIKGSDYPVTERAVDVQIVGLRKKLGDADLIETVRGVGYKFKNM